MRVIQGHYLVGFLACLNIAMLWGCSTTAVTAAYQDPAAHLLSRSQAQFQQGHTDRAIEMASQAIVRSPNNAEAWNARGFLHHSQGLKDQAQRDFTEAIRLNPNQPLHHGNLGVVYLESGDYRKALDTFNDALRA